MCSDTLINPYSSNYEYLSGLFFNFDDIQRNFIGTNFPQIDDTIKSYLMYKGLVKSINKV